MSDSDQATVKQAGLEIIQDSAVTPRRSADWCVPDRLKFDPAAEVRRY